MGNARKYSLVMNSVISCGLGSYTGSTVTCSLLPSFTINYDTVPATSCTYPTLSTTQLQSLSTIEYDNRVIDFLDYINLESGVAKEILYSGSTTTEPECSGYYCLLNPNFLVYKFLNGIRVVNVGSANGVVQYLVSGGTYNSGWQPTGTFLNLDPNGIFTVAIRDYVASEDFVVCEYNTLISLPALIPSTTVTLTPKVIAFNQLSVGSTGPTTYKTGCIQVSPSALSPGQKVLINYTSNATLAGSSGSACVHLTCRPNGSGSFVNYDCLTNLNVSPRNNSVTLCYGDVVCYAVIATAGTYGATACANICMTSVNGLSTTVPTIDITRCSAASVAVYPPLSLTTSMNRLYVDSPVLGVCLAGGTFGFSPAIPNGQCVQIQLSSITTSNGGTAQMAFYCKPNGGTSYLCVDGVNSTQIQPQIATLTARYGDSLCYCMTVVAPSAGITSSACACISNLSGSIGVLPLKSTTNNCDNISATRSALPVSIALCRQQDYGQYASGYINVTPALPTCGQCVTVCYQVNQTVCGYGDAIINIFCKPNGGSSFLPYCLLKTEYPTPCGVPNGTFIMRYGDQLCYNNTISTSDFGSCSDICIKSVISTSEVSASINVSKCCDSVKFLS